MFGPSSRYASIATAVHAAADGREIRYVRRRFLPRGATLPTLAETVVSDGDRLDLIAARALSSSEAWWRIADAADAMRPRDLERPGRRLRVPIPGVAP